MTKRHYDVTSAMTVTCQKSKQTTDYEIMCTSLTSLLSSVRKYFLDVQLTAEQPQQITGNYELEIQP